jgi:hypothetical protein
MFVLPSKILIVNNQESIEINDEREEREGERERENRTLEEFDPL